MTQEFNNYMYVPNIINAKISLFVMFSRLNRWIDLAEFWYRDRLNLGEVLLIPEKHIVPRERDNLSFTRTETRATPIIQ